MRVFRRMPLFLFMYIVFGGELVIVKFRERNALSIYGDVTMYIIYL